MMVGCGDQSTQWTLTALSESGGGEGLERDQGVAQIFAPSSSVAPSCLHFHQYTRLWIGPCISTVVSGPTVVQLLFHYRLLLCIASTKPDPTLSYFSIMKSSELHQYNTTSEKHPWWMYNQELLMSALD